MSKNKINEKRKKIFTKQIETQTKFLGLKLKNENTNSYTIDKIIESKGEFFTAEEKLFIFPYEYSPNLKIL